MKTYRIIEDPSTKRVRAIVALHRPALGLYGKELGVVLAFDHTEAMRLAAERKFVTEEPVSEPW